MTTYLSWPCFQKEVVVRMLQEDMIAMKYWTVNVVDGRKNTTFYRTNEVGRLAELHERTMEPVPKNATTQQNFLKGT